MGVFSDVAHCLLESDKNAGSSRFRPLVTGPTLNDFLLALSRAMDVLEGKPLRSAMKVAVLAGSIANLLGMPRRESAAVVYAALLHDIGLASLVSELYPFLSPGGGNEKTIFRQHALYNAEVIPYPPEKELSDAFIERLERHPLRARDVIEKMGMSSDVGELIEAHHELWDGSGYPRGLRGHEIPLGARVLAFADVVEGVLNQATHDAPGLLSRRMALDAFLDTQAEGRFDPEVVAVFRRMLDDNDDLLRQLTSLELESMVRQLLPERYATVDGYAMYRLAMVMGQLADNLMPEFKRGRSQKIASIAMKLANTLGIGPEQCGELGIAGLVMDLGHLGTPSTILFKPGRLTLDEKNILYDHPRVTQEILKVIPGFENIGLWASEHHERINGHGYPAQKRGFEISVGGRILALADVFDAMTSERPYRPHAYDAQEALPVLAQGQHHLFDSRLVGELQDLFQKRKIYAD